VKRRDFMTLLAGAAAAWPLGTRAQQSSISVIGLLSGNRFEEHELAAIRTALAEAGFIEGRNVAIEYRSADGQYGRLPTLAAELVRRPVALIMAIGGTASAIAAKASTSTIPIVFANGSDPVKDVWLPVSTGDELFPRATTVAVLVNRNNPNADVHVQDATAAADAFKLKLIVVRVGSESEFEGAFETTLQQQVGALTVAPDAFFNNRRDRIVQLAARHKLATMYDERRLRRRRWLNRLWCQSCRRLSAGRPLCRPNSQGGQAGRSARHAGYEVRLVHQHQDRQSTRSRNSADAARHGRRGDRIEPECLSH
jgi:ABC-type uncharacterized transport system substrate-binding protein